MDLPTNAEVYCSDDFAGISTYIIGNPANHQLTHLVVQSDLPPARDYLVPIEQVDSTSLHRVNLKCTREEFIQFKLFKNEEFIPTDVPGHLSWPFDLPLPEASLETTGYIPVEHLNIPQGELALRCGTQVNATDGYLGQVEDLLINPNNMQITHLVLLKQHLVEKRIITIPVSQVEYVDEDENTVFLKLDRKSVEALPTTAVLHWPL